MSGERLTRTELSWLLTQEAKSAAEKLRKGVGLITPATPVKDGAPDSKAEAKPGPESRGEPRSHQIIPPAPIVREQRDVTPPPSAVAPVSGSSGSPASPVSQSSTPSPPIVSTSTAREALPPKELVVKESGPSSRDAVHVNFFNEDTGVESVLNRLDETMSMLASLYGNQPRGRRGKIDVAALLWEIAPEARFQIEMGKGLVVLGDEAELRRMLHVLMALGGDPTTLGAVAVSVRRDDNDIRIAVELGPDKTRGFEAETQWLSRMATRYGGHWMLEGNSNMLLLPAADPEPEVDELRRELAAAQAQGEAYARELAAVMSSRSEPPPPRSSSSVGPAPSDSLPSLGGMARSLVTDVRGILSAIGREMAPLRERGRWGDRDAEISEIGASVGRHVTAASEVVSDLARLAGMPLFELPAPCNVAELIRDVVKGEQLRATRHGVTIHVDLPNQVHDDVLPVGSVHILFQELLNSAVSVSHADSRVYVAMTDSSSGVVVTIDDSGPSLTSKAKTGAIARDFDALVQERAAALPLIAAFAIASHLHAPLTLEDSPRGGTRARVVFPRLS
ncbi:MAG: sensor histidine kinase [Polyangiaceae bacterium]